MNIKRIIKNIYKKLNPTFVITRRIEEKVDGLHYRFNIFEDKLNHVLSNLQTVDERSLERKMLLTEPKVYRYLYMNRYIHTGDTIVDLEAEYGAGDNLLLELSPVGKIVCLNTIEHFTNLGRAYYQSDLLEYKTGFIEQIGNKVQLILALNSKQNAFSNQEIKKIYDSLDIGGYFAVAISILEENKKDNFINLIKDNSFEIEKILYQKKESEKFVEEFIADSILFIIAKRNK